MNFHTRNHDLVLDGFLQSFPERREHVNRIKSIPRFDQHTSVQTIAMSAFGAGQEPNLESSSIFGMCFVRTSR